MARLLLAIIIALYFTGLNAQKVQWASKVISFSSELTSVQYSATQALGKPNVLPAGGENPNAWTPDKPNRKEYIMLGFDEPMSIMQVAIAESYNPSALTRVSVFDEQNIEYEIIVLEANKVPLKSRMLCVFTDKTPYKVKAVKLEFNGAIVGDYFSIDAVAIADVNIPVVADITRPVLLASNIEVERLNENVNSEYPELNPLLSPDGKTLYFSRRNHPENMGGVNDAEDIWYAELDSAGQWQKAKNMGPEFNNAYPNYINTISAATPDGKSVIFLLGNKYTEKGKMVAGVSMSSKVGDTWTMPQALVIENDYNFNEKANYFLANNRKVLLMSIEREDSYGDRDLYVSFLKKDSTWSSPLNMGSTLNTSGTESAPFIAADDKTLYFSSNGFSGYGGSDIYVSTRLDDSWTKWSEPENLGPEINSPLEDLFFNIPAFSEYAYYSRGVSQTDLDIFRVKLPIFKSPEPVILVKGRLTDSKTGEPLGAKIIYERLSDGKEMGITQSDPKTGNFEILLPAGELYGFRAEAENYISESQHLDLRNYKESSTFDHKDIGLNPIRDLRAAPIEEDAVVVLNNVFFFINKAVMKKESFPELNRTADILKDRPTMIIEVAGHTCDLGPDDFNLYLSEQRAKAVVNYLIEKGVDKDRLSIRFYGKNNPTVPNTTAENRMMNRRVEFKIVKK